MRALKVVIALVLLDLTRSQVTRRENVLLSRKRRYLSFPAGSNFVITLSWLKALLVQFPPRINILGECDVPFTLPSDPRLFRHRHRSHHYIHKRDIYSTLEMAFEENGLNGNACVKRMICEAHNIMPQKGKSMVGDLLTAVFNFTEVNTYNDHNFQDYCHSSVFDECEVPFLMYILGSMTGQNK